MNAVVLHVLPSTVKLIQHWICWILDWDVVCIPNAVLGSLTSNGVKWSKRQDLHFCFTDVESCSSCKCSEFSYFDDFLGCGWSMGKSQSWTHPNKLLKEEAMCIRDLVLERVRRQSDMATVLLLHWFLVDFLFWSPLAPRHPRLRCRDLPGNFQQSTSMGSQQALSAALIKLLVRCWYTGEPLLDGLHRELWLAKARLAWS